MFETPQQLVVVWSSGASASRTATIGRLVQDTVEPVGEPIYVGPANAVGRLGIAGGVDPITGHVWFDSPNGIDVVELDADGTLLQVAAHGALSTQSAVTRVDDWVRLADGRWVAKSGSWLCEFDPLDRSTEQCVLVQPIGAPDGFLGMLDIVARSDGALHTVWHVSQ